MSEKRFFKSYFTKQIIDKVDDKCYPLRDYEGADDLVDLLNEYDDFKTELTEILQKEYAHLTKGMYECGREENWVGYRAFQLERSPIIRIARKLGIDLNE